MAITNQDARSAVIGLFGREPDEVEWPGGRSRRTFCVRYDETRYAVSKRGGPGRARLEATILERLQDTRHTPDLVLCRDEWVVQSWTPGQRLAERLALTPTPALVADAAAALARLQRAGTMAGLDKIAPRIGQKAGWLDRFSGLPASLAENCALPAPTFDGAGIRSILSSAPASFVKWDSRPGNALIDPSSGRAVWIDWEHAGCRVIADDLAWLVCDEWFPDDGNLETAAISGFCAEYSNRFDFDFGRYLSAFGCLHTMVRINLVLDFQSSHGWGDRAHLLAKDKIGATPDLLKRLAIRGARWAARYPETDGLTDFFVQLSTSSLAASTTAAPVTDSEAGNDKA